ncbi:MAG: UDP-N-acetylmuramate--L-alanine ligase [Sumerlaeia bacterium]
MTDYPHSSDPLNSTPKHSAQALPPLPLSPVAPYKYQQNQSATNKGAFGFRTAHMIGVGGCGMNAIAHALLAMGIKVTGSDLKESKATLDLRKAGAVIFIGHDAENLQNPDVTIISTAIPERNPELQRARGEGRTILHRSEALALFLSTRESILITGTHGKTTTSAITSIMMAAGQLNPWSFVGGYVPAFSGNCRCGGDRFAVAEADESDGTFEKLPVQHLIVTNIEDEHLDYWKTGSAMRMGFRRVYESVPETGVRLCCLDDAGVRELLSRSTLPCVGYSVQGNSAAAYSAANIDLQPFHSSFDLMMQGTFYARYTIGVPGIHNVSNAVAALAMTNELGGDLTLVAQALKEFHGVGRRFEIKGQFNGISVIDDYGHHPTEIRVTLKAAKKAAESTNGKLIVVFQPHRYSRTRDTLSELAASFNDASALILLPIYSAGEKPLDGVHNDSLFLSLSPSVKKLAQYRENAREVAELLRPTLQQGDIVLTIGAGDVYRISDELCEQLTAEGV